MNGQQQKKAAQEFADYWADKGYEKGESQKFWMSLLHNVYGVDQPEKLLEFEDQVHLDHTSFIDVMIPSTKVMIEQKGRDKDLRKAIKQSDGSLLTPFQQAKRYITELPVSLHPRYVITCNFQEFLIYNMDDPQGEPQQILLKDLPKEAYRLEFLVDPSRKVTKQEIEVSIQAGRLVGKLYDALLKKYQDPANPHSLKSLNVLCVRLVFCLYAEDAGIFGTHSQFHDYLKTYREQNVRKALIDLFKMLDTRPEDRDPYENENLLAFPYVNGGLFADENIEIPRLDDEIVELLVVECSEQFDWSKISPTIFGAVFESTLNPATRRSGGMHYTSIENIHKVIDPLFLDDLRKELQEIESLTVERTRREKLLAYQDKLAHLEFLDPACGSGNFLTETYLSLRKLENEAIGAYNHGQMTLGDFYNPVKVSIRQFYGIEINDFAVTVAKTALWIAESQMLQQTEAIVHQAIDFLPLKTNASIVEGNALRMDWENVVPKAELNYIMGNPPFRGYSLQTKDQKADILSVYVDEKGKPYKTAGKIDYVAGWYFKAADYMQGTAIRIAFVSTNSITQGEQVAGVWKPLYDRFRVHIDFAYRTFIWSSEAAEKAAVHCVIVGFSEAVDNVEKVIYDGELKRITKNISPYLVDAPTIFIENRSKPLCNVSLMHRGSQPTDDGNFIFTKEEYQSYIKKNPASASLFRKYMMGKDFISRKPRYCLWLVNIPSSQIRKYPEIVKRIEAVKEYRLKSTKAATRKKADTPTLFDENHQPGTNFVALPTVSSGNRRYIPMDFMTPDIVVGNKIYVTENATIYEFGIMNSNVHMAWTRVVAGRLKSDFNYSNTVVYNNFPWPNPEPEQKAKIEETAQAILDARANHPEDSLADLYDPLFMPADLRKAHQENDKAVMTAYGFDWRHMSESDCVAELMKLYQKLTEKQ